jgi:hypothetical protein
VSRHDLAPDEAEIMLAELHAADPPPRPALPATYLVAPCPRCGAPIEAPANVAASAAVRLTATGDGWESYRAVITATGAAVHIHRTD